MRIRDTLLAGLARQLRRPTGIRGVITGRRLNRFNQDSVLAAVAATQLEPGQTAADIGFGGGVGLPPLLERVGAHGHVYGIDLSQTMLRMARRRFKGDVANGRLTLERGDLGDLPLPDDSLDTLITVNTVYFLTDLDRATAELARVLRPGGRAVVGVGDPDAMASMPVVAHGFTVRPIDELTHSLVASGFATPRDVRVGDGEGAFHLLVADLPAQ